MPCAQSDPAHPTQARDLDIFHDSVRVITPSASILALLGAVSLAASSYCGQRIGGSQTTVPAYGVDVVVVDGGGTTVVVVVVGATVVVVVGGGRVVVVVAGGWVVVVLGWVVVVDGTPPVTI